MYFPGNLTTTSGRPWSEVNNPKSPYGFFIDIEKPEFLFEYNSLWMTSTPRAKYILGDIIPSLNNIQNLSSSPGLRGENIGFHSGRSLLPCGGQNILLNQYTSATTHQI
jgi:hypothetical protein